MTGVRPAIRRRARRNEGSRRLGRRSVLSALSSCRGHRAAARRVRIGAVGPRTRSLSAVAQLVRVAVVLVLAVLWQIRAVLRSSHPWLRAVEARRSA